MDTRHVVEGWSPIARSYHPLTCGSIDGTDDYPHDKAILRALNSSYKPNKWVYAKYEGWSACHSSGC